jgi:carbonic anhydrase/acetyltransferase-like protein (isoleucine patch superfamily)
MTLFALDGVQPRVPDDGDYWVAPGAMVMGSVEIGAGASVWFGAVIRGDNDLIVLGAGCNIQDNSVLHTDAGFPMHIGADVTVGHRAILHGCIVGEGSLIGMGATLLNGSVIGKGCLIGAGALVPEGKIIPDGSLVLGMPGKVVRQLDSKARQELRETAHRYVLNQRRFRAGMYPVPDL